MSNCKTKNKNMGFGEKMKLKVLVLFKGVSDELASVLRNINDHDNLKKSKSCNNINDGNDFNIVKGWPNGLATDAVPSSKKNTKNKLSSSGSLLNVNEQTDLPNHICTSTVSSHHHYRNSTDLDKIKTSQSVDDDGEYNFSEDETIKNSSKRKMHNKENNKSSGKQKKNRNKSPNEGHSFNYRALSNSYTISHSKDIHIGPSFNQNIILDKNESKMKYKSTINETIKIKEMKRSTEPVTDAHILFLSEYIGDNWKFLGRDLGYTNGQLEQLMNDHKRHREVVYQLLLDWIQDQTDNASCGRLCTALWKVDEKEAVVKLVEFLTN